MPLELVRVFWQSHPYGWLLRWLNEEGRYAGELLSSAPPRRDLCSGTLNSDDAATAWRLVRAILEAETRSPQHQSSAPHIGFVVPVTEDDVEPEFGSYYYYDSSDKRLSTRYYVQLVLILDSYMRLHYESLIQRDNLWE